ncbi:MAG: DEAD/DEAH box helicase [Treponema sp.]|jgi:ATP-dependent RNA helicase RhlB|nr:DEAD/DEAH box helicase [Treponema sp.]
MEFKNFNLHPDLQKGIDEAGYINCMPVQEQVLTHAFGEHGAPAQDLYVQSQTGTGKTAAFLVVIFQRMLTEEALFKRKALIMAPTRELAVQIEEEAKMLGKYLPFKTGSFYGGVGYAQQEKLLRENAQILVGTPGRVLDLNKSGRMNLMEIAFLVLDEADRMFDMGFYPDLRKLIRVVPSTDRRQTMLFSATLNAWVKNLAWEYTKSPFEIDIEPDVVTVEEVTQILYHVPSEEKMPLMLGILKREHPESAIIFCNTKKSTEIVAKRLKINGYDCEFIIGDLPQAKRLKVIDDVKAGKIKTLVATDVAARGLDIESLAMVINYDLPVEAENYVHRIGRTARAGKTGKAITLSSEQDVYELPAIERYIGKKIPSEIAAQELYDEDKSAGMRIHADYYEERRVHTAVRGTASARGTAPARGAKGAGGKRNDGMERSDRRKPDEPRRSRERSGHKRETPHGGHVARNSDSARNNDAARNSDAVRNSEVTRKPSEKPAGQDMSQLSMEERMAHYKKKYAGPEAKHGGNREHGRKDAKHHHSPNAGKTNHHDVQHSGKRQEQPTSEKKGILSKFIGLFKKKK